MKNMKITSIKADYIPSKNEGDSLLVVLHGLGDSAFGYQFLPGILNIPGLSYLLLNAPDPYFGGYSWFDLENPTQGILRSREKLFRLVEELERNGWSNDKIGFFGFSQGALMCLDIAARFPKKLGPIIAISGFVFFLEKLPQELSAIAKDQKILATHGQYDSMLPLGPTKSQVAELCKLGMSIRWKEYAKDHTIDPEKEIPDIRSFLLENLS